MDLISRTAYWSAYVSRAIVMATLVLTPLLVGYSAMSLAWLAFVLGAPVDIALDFTVEASVALTDRLLLLGLIAVFFALVSLIARWFVWHGNNHEIASDSVPQGHPLAVLLSALLEPLNRTLRIFLNPPVNWGESRRTDSATVIMPVCLAGAFPAWSRPPPADVLFVLRTLLPRAGQLITGGISCLLKPYWRLSRLELSCS